MAEVRGKQKLDPMANHYDTLVIGAGAVGLAITKALIEADLSVLLVEKEDSVGQGTSSRSSSLAHVHFDG